MDVFIEFVPDEPRGRTHYVNLLAVKLITVFAPGIISGTQWAVTLQTLNGTSGVGFKLFDTQQQANSFARTIRDLANRAN